ncbi:MAG: type II toxin-antitoxin system prevent-host-death family antitoxin [Micrococcales bacterium]|nr:type II toxin-antitoxin system prevent-host-death family antitoxin [Micrococcales bacterium]
MSVLDPTRRISVTEAHSLGVSGLVRGAETGGDVIVTRHGRPVAAVVSTQHLEALRALEDDLRDAALVIVRAASDAGVRGSLDDTITAFGFDRAQLEAELEADLAAGRE